MQRWTRIFNLLMMFYNLIKSILEYLGRRRSMSLPPLKLTADKCVNPFAFVL